MRRTLRAALSVLVILGFLSCNLFKTRTPEEPTQNSTGPVTSSYPEEVLENMIQAFHDGSSYNYMKLLSASSFHFTPSTGSQLKYAGELMIWDLPREQRYFENVLLHLKANSSVNLTFDAYTPTFIDDSSRRIETSYHVSVPHTVTGVAQTFVGQVQIIVVRNQLSSEWFIKEWSDFGSTDSTWSDLKGIAYTQW